MKLKYKITLITIGLLLLVMLLTAAVSLNQFRTNYREAMLAGTIGVGSSLNTLVSELLALGLPLDSLDGMDERLLRMLRENPYLTYVAIVDLEGRPIYHSDARLVGRRFDDAVMRQALAADAPLIQRYPRFDGQVYDDVSLPVRDPAGQKVGLIRLGYDVRQVSDKVWAMVWRGGAIFMVAFVLLVVLLNLLLSRMVSRRVEALAEHAKAIADGRFEPRTPVPRSSEDEIDALADALDSMAATLREQMHALRASNASLALAKENAERANRAKTAFLANMSHELGTPLNAVLGFAQLLARDERLPADARAQVENILQSGRQLLDLINDVLEIARIESGHGSVRAAVFDLRAMLGTLVEVMQLRAEKRGLEFRVEADWNALPRYVEADAHRLRQVLGHLIDNAIKFTERGGVVLRVRPEEGRLRFEVEDSGPGIAVADQAHLFDPFYQTELGVRRGEGTGLGLTLCREYVERMGGRIELESAPGRGSRFAFTLPIVARQPLPEDPPAVEAEPVVFERETIDASVLDADQRARLARAALTLDGEAVRHLIAELRPAAPALAGRLESWLEEYRFDAMERLLAAEPTGNDAPV